MKLAKLRNNIAKLLEDTRDDIMPEDMKYRNQAINSLRDTLRIKESWRRDLSKVFNQEGFDNESILNFFILAMVDLKDPDLKYISMWPGRPGYPEYQEFK